MQDELNRFWIPVAQILPVFILGLVIEARLALAPRTSKTKKIARREAKKISPRYASVIGILDAISRILYALVFVAAMVFLVTAFILCVAVLAGGKISNDSVQEVLVALIIGAVLTGLLPVSRLWEDIVLDHLAEAYLWIRKSIKTRRKPRSSRSS